MPGGYPDQGAGYPQYPPQGGYGQPGKLVRALLKGSHPSNRVFEKKIFNFSFVNHVTFQWFHDYINFHQNTKQAKKLENLKLNLFMEHPACRSDLIALHEPIYCHMFCLGGVFLCETFFSSCPLLTTSDNLYFCAVKSVNDCHLQPKGNVTDLSVRLCKNLAVFKAGG